MRLRGQCFRLGLCHLPSDRGGAWARRCRGASSLSLPSLPQAHHAPRTPALRSMLSSKCVMSPPPLPCVMGRKTASPLQGRWRVEHSKGPRQINQRSDQTSSRTYARPHAHGSPGHGVMARPPHKGRGQRTRGSEGEVAPRAVRGAGAQGSTGPGHLPEVAARMRKAPQLCPSGDALSTHRLGCIWLQITPCRVAVREASAEPFPNLVQPCVATTATIPPTDKDTRSCPGSQGNRRPKMGTRPSIPAARPASPTGTQAPPPPPAPRPPPPALPGGNHSGY